MGVDVRAAARRVALAMVLCGGVTWAQGPKGVAGTDAGNWTAKRIYDVFRNEQRCVVETPPATIDDGRSQTKVLLRVDSRSVTVMTQSNVDIAHADVGIQVDDNKLIKPDKVFLDQNALFETQAEQIIAQFKPGLVAEVRLRFWPTWPDKGLKTVRFSLIGFTRAYARLPAC